MTRFLNALALAALIVLTVLSLDARLAGVRADDKEDCISGRGETKIRGCSGIIKSGRLNGEPISKDKLAYVLSIRGNAYVDNGQYDRAITDYGTAIKLEPKFMFHYLLRGIAHEKKGQYERAIADLDKAIKLNPKYADSYNIRGEAYEKLGQRDKAIADYRKAIELSSYTYEKEKATSGLKRLGTTSVATIPTKQRPPTSGGSRGSAPSRASAGCFGNNLGAASIDWNVHYNWAERQSSETLRQDLSTKTRNVFDCSSVNRQNLNGIFAALSRVVGIAAPDPACFDGNRGASSPDFLGHHHWARSQPRNVLRDDAVWKISSVFSCADRSRQAHFFAKVSVILAKALQTGRWIDTHGYGDWSGNDFACTGGVKPDAKHCNPAQSGAVAVCWNPKDQQTGYPFKECKGYTSWCTYKSVSLSQKQTGTKPGRVYICSANNAKSYSVLGHDTVTWHGSAADYATSSGLSLEVGMGNAISGYGFAGIELLGARILDVSVAAPSRYQHHDANAFAGFMIDYHTSDGYSSRVALSIGIMDRKRWDKPPNWGTEEVPNVYHGIGRHSTYFIDLKLWAPPDWDGRVWFSLGIQNAGRNNRIKARLSVH